MEPLVSVVIPCYNMERYISEALESVCMQTYINLQIIVVDDGSTDRSRIIVSKYRDVDQRVILITKTNGGLSTARNYGIDQANGKYIAFLDADDYWHVEKIAKHVLHMEANQKIGVSYSGTQYISEQGRLLHRRIPKHQKLNDYDLYCRNPITNGSNALFRSEIFMVHRFDETKIHGHEDVDCWMRIAFTPKKTWLFEGIPEALTFYRVTNGSMSDDYYRHYKEAKRSWEKSFLYAPDVAKKYARLAEAFQLRFYARRAIAAGNSQGARRIIIRALRVNPRIIICEGMNTALTLLVSFFPSVWKRHL